MLDEQYSSKYNPVSCLDRHREINKTHRKILNH